MSIPKGYTTKERETERILVSDHNTSQPVRQKQVGQDTVAHQFVREVGTDTCEAGCTTTILNLTAHSAEVGDIIRFTSGNLSGHEVRVIKVTADTVELGEILSEAPSTDNIQILRHKFPIVNADGSLSTSVTVNTGGVFLEDSAHTNGDQVMAVASVRQDTLAASTDTDGDYAAIKSNASGEIYVADETAQGSLATIAGDTTSIDGKITACDTTGKATEAKQDSIISELQDIEADVEANTALLTTIDADTGTIAGDTTSIDGKITACDTGNVTVASSALPTGAATEATASAIQTAIESLDSGLTPVDFLDSGLVDSSSSNITTGGLTVVSSLAADVKEIEIQEDIGEYMALTDGTDAVLAYLPLGGGRIKVNISSGTELKLASLTGSSITLGSIAMNLLG